MNDGILGVFVLTLIGLTTSICTNFFIKKKVAALLLPVLIGCVTFQLLGYIYLGHFDPFFIISIIISGFVLLIISLLVNILFRYFRKGV